MATDSPLIHDGSQCTAGASLGAGDLALSLGGPGGTGQFLAVVLSASRTLVVASSTILPIYGVLQNTPLLLDACDVGIAGITKAVAGAGGVTFGAELMINASGQFVNWSFVTNVYKVGMALETAVATQVFSMLIYSPNVRSPVA